MTKVKITNIKGWGRLLGPHPPTTTTMEAQTGKCGDVWLVGWLVGGCWTAERDASAIAIFTQKR
jgi:hypothetical protein